ncbi:unnamed protein product [Musa acuminata subsp. burmannicoides]
MEEMREGRDKGRDVSTRHSECRHYSRGVGFRNPKQQPGFWSSTTTYTTPFSLIFAISNFKPTAPSHPRQLYHHRSRPSPSCIYLPTTEADVEEEEEEEGQRRIKMNSKSTVENSLCRSDDLNVELTLGVSPSRHVSNPPSSSSSLLPPPPPTLQQQPHQYSQTNLPPPFPPVLHVPRRYTVIPPPTNPAAAVASSSSASASPRSGGGRTRRNPTQGPRSGKSDSIKPIFPWSTDRRATVHSLSYLLSHDLKEVYGDAQCKRCEARRIIRYDLESKFREVACRIAATRHLMHDRAPAEWMNPTFPDCDACGQPNCMRPVVDGKKRNINWLFMLLGQTLGYCTLEQLKYFCKHTKNHRTGAKDRVLYLTYLGLCKQLDPNGPFDL